MHSLKNRRSLRAICAHLLVFAALPAIADTKPFDLLAIKQLGTKGRVQDPMYQRPDQQIDAILAAGKDAIPFLIEALESERPYERPPAPYWPAMKEGDVALIVLTDLFLDSSWMKTSLPELCWDNLLERTSPDTPAWELFEDFVRAHGRAGLANRWRQAWERIAEKVKWDAAERYFKVDGVEPTDCSPLS